MKKLLILLLCLTTALCITGCSSKTEDKQVDEPSNVIDLGGGLGKITLEGDAFGSYKKVETIPEKFIYEDTVTTIYEDLESDTPYVVIYRFAKNGYTLEEIAKEEADLYANGYYQLYDCEGVINQEGAYICAKTTYNDNYYYVDEEIFEDGDDFVEIDILAKTEELQIGDTGVYAYVPVGYTSYMDDDYKAHNSYFAATYSDEYYFPNMFIGKWDFSYEYYQWYFEEDFPEGLPFTEEEYATELEKYTNGEIGMNEYYGSLGDTIVYDSYEANELFDYNGGYYVLEGGKVEGTEIWFEIDGDWYIAWFGYTQNPKPAYARAFLNSLHTK